ncbi:LysR family transcriptional regulator [Acinetobacter sp. P8-3-8]|uniref:LysR family transcriptional regulator n=1 Tax=Acinetobacter sp. P8-3-8 TaxID=1029823 RepID=UPI000248601B|nr:LysR family transcriptional regulator [Acinetobacter sp. P8-3-8]
MDLKDLRIFAEIVNHQSFSLAADHLCMTQPTISKAIKHLEEDLATALFKKGEAGRKREVALTYEGELIYQHAMNMLNEQNKIFETLNQVQNLKKGSLTIGLPPLGSLLLTPLIALFHKHYPEIQLKFLEVGGNGVEEAIANKTVDVGVLLENLRPNFAAIPIVNSPMCLLSKKESHWNQRETVNLAELKEESFLLYADSFVLNKLITQATNAVGFEPKVVCKSSQWDFIVKMVELNMGIAILPKIYCDQLDPDKFSSAILLEPSLHWVLSMAWNTSMAMSPATKAWLNIVELNLDKIHF